MPLFMHRSLCLVLMITVLFADSISSTGKNTTPVRLCQDQQCHGEDEFSAIRLRQHAGEGEELTNTTLKTVLPIPFEWLKTKELPKCRQKSPQGVLRIEGGDLGAGFATLLFLYPINHILLAEAYCLQPVAAMNKKYAHLFYDESRAENVWEYFFEPLPASKSAGKFKTIYHVRDNIQYLELNYAPWSVKSWHYHKGSSLDEWAHRDMYLEAWYYRNRRLAAGVVSRYFKLNAAMQAESQKLWNSRIGNSKSSIVLGIHYRGTDKHGGRYHETPDAYLPYIEAFLETNPKGKVLLATDDYKVQEGMLHGAWPARVKAAIVMANEITADSQANRDLRNSRTHNFNVGVECLMDIVLLSKCNFLLHGQSSMAEAPIYLNFALHNRSIPVGFSNRPTPSPAFFHT
eukprot:gnl/TRDRNA2_/TRDRNA2_40608_c0_seq1.p1 gnl/TRDRNA2_/TRDRNA2_40608_c0~~gnl/TRDRNA2_/TRDRNA2_40608_c0_seq1.p1  ORF type:complete len:402 (-),score=35.58 gnl/TRDRNA2_/TRDRNA2_40608_c0_seq1:59-1264(-)